MQESQPDDTAATHLLRHMLESQPVRMRPPTTAPLAEAEERLLELLPALWAESTWRANRGLWARLRRFAETNRIGLNDTTAALFVASLPIAQTSRLAYTKTFAAIFRRMGMQATLLDMLSASLRRSGALLPENQAVPATRDDVAAVAVDLPPRDKAAFLLAWKTASRWSDIAALQGHHFHRRLPHSIVIDWAADTKSSRGNPYQPQLLVEVTGDWTPQIAAAIQDLGDKESLTAITTAQAARMLASVRPELTAHSIKRGAVDALTAAAAAGEIELELVGMVAKHSGKYKLPQSTLRYAANRISLAVALGTGRATRML